MNAAVATARLGTAVRTRANWVQRRRRGQQLPLESLLDVQIGRRSGRIQAARFFAVSLASLALNLAVLELICRAGAVAPITAQAIAVAVATPFNFLGNKLWTFA
jgi:hypothetical protein